MNKFFKSLETADDARRTTGRENRQAIAAAESETRSVDLGHILDASRTGGEINLSAGRLVNLAADGWIYYSEIHEEILLTEAGRSEVM
jgi:hypothetical protein